MDSLHKPNAVYKYKCHPATHLYCEYKDTKLGGIKRLNVLIVENTDSAEYSNYNNCNTSLKRRRNTKIIQEKMRIREDSTMYFCIIYAFHIYFQMKYTN